MALYWGRVGGRGVGVPPRDGVAGVPPRDGGSFALVSAPGAMPPPAKGWGGLVNWHSLVLVFSYKVRPSGNCVVFHRGSRPPTADSWTVVASSLDNRRATPLC